MNKVIITLFILSLSLGCGPKRRPKRGSPARTCLPNLLAMRETHCASSLLQEGLLLTAIILIISVMKIFQTGWDNGRDI